MTKMIGFSIEFKRWYLVLRGPKGRVYSAIGFAKQMPVLLPTHSTTLDQYLADRDDELVFTTQDGEELFRL
jgi:hypothetical protein